MRIEREEKEHIYQGFKRWTGVPCGQAGNQKAGKGLAALAKKLWQKTGMCLSVTRGGNVCFIPW